LAEGKYAPEYARKRRAQRGKPHGNDDQISAAHRAHGEKHFKARSHTLHDPAPPVLAILEPLYLLLRGAKEKEQGETPEV